MESAALSRVAEDGGLHVCSTGGCGDSKFPAAAAFRVGALLGQFPGSEEAVVAAAAKAMSQQRRRGNSSGSDAATAAPEERRRRSSVGDVRLGELARRVGAQQRLRFSGSTTTQD